MNYIVNYFMNKEDNLFSGFLYNKENNDYLCTSLSIGYIYKWDLYNNNYISLL